MSEFAASYLWILGGAIALLVVALVARRVFGGGGSWSDDSVRRDDWD